MGVVQHESNVLGLPLVIIGIFDGGGDVKLPVGSILYERRSWMHITLETVNQLLVGAMDEGCG